MESLTQQMNCALKGGEVAVLIDTWDPGKMQKKQFLENFKAVKIQGLAMSTNLSQPEHYFERCNLRDIIREISVKMSTGKLSFFHI